MKGYVEGLSVRRIDRTWGQVPVAKCGRFRVTRHCADTVAGTSARVTLDRTGQWYVSFTTPPPASLVQANRGGGWTWA